MVRAIDRDSNLIEETTRNFFKIFKETTWIILDQVTTYHEKAFPSAIANTLGSKVKHSTSQYKNDLMEQNHSYIKSRYGAMKGFKDPWCAMIFCTVFEEKNFLDQEIVL